MSDSVFGNARYGNEFTKRKHLKLTDGDSIPVRILPSIGELAKDGVWSRFYRIHFGYKDSKGKMKVFQSSLVKNNKTKMIEVPDAALEKIELLRAAQASAIKAGDAAKAETLKKLLSTYNLDSNHYMNVIDQQGNIYVLKIRHKAKLALDAVIKQLRTKGIDPLSADNGRFFVFNRQGTGNQTIFAVNVLTKDLNVEGVGTVQQDVVHKLTDEIADRCAVRKTDGTFTYKEAVNLDKMYLKATAEQIARIVKEGARAVDEIFDTKSTQAESTSEEVYEEEEENSSEVATHSSSASSNGSSSKETTTTTESKEKPTTVSVTTAPVKKTEAPTPQPQKTQEPDYAKMNESEFMKSLGLEF